MKYHPLIFISKYMIVFFFIEKTAKISEIFLHYLNFGHKTLKKNSISRDFRKISYPDPGVQARDDSMFQQTSIQPLKKPGSETLQKWAQQNEA